MELLPPELAALIPAKTLSLLIAAHYAWNFIILRAWKNWKAGGGFYGIKKAFFQGEKISEAKDIDNAKDIKVAEDKRATQAPFTIPPQ